MVEAVHNTEITGEEGGGGTGIHSVPVFNTVYEITNHSGVANRKSCECGVLTPCFNFPCFCS